MNKAMTNPNTSATGGDTQGVRQRKAVMVKTSSRRVMRASKILSVLIISTKFHHPRPMEKSLLVMRYNKKLSALHLLVMGGKSYEQLG